MPHDAIEVAGDGRLALEAIRSAQAAGEPFALVLLDLNMPEMTGDVVLRELVGSPGGAANVVIVTGDDLPGRRRQLRELGVAGHLVKPFKPEQVREIARRARVAA